MWKIGIFRCKILNGEGGEMTEEQRKIIDEIERDITYFDKLDFKNLVSKFQRDLDLIKSLVSSN